MTYEFKSLSYREALALADSQETFVVDGLISASSTLLYGEAKVGKSFLASNLIHALSTGGDFLGVPVEQRGWRVAVVVTDDAGEAEYAGRIRTLGEDDISARFYPIPIMRGREMWQALFTRVVDDGCNAVVLDNLSQAIDGSFNDDAPVRRFFEGVRIFTRAGMPVIIVGHSSEKSGDQGKSHLPMGSSTISQSVRHRIFVKRSRAGNLTLSMTGNHAEAHSLVVKHGIGARFDVVEAKAAEAVRAEADVRTRERERVTLDKNAEIARFVASECRGQSQRQIGQAIADRFGGNADSHRTTLSTRRGWAAMLMKTEAGEYALQPLTAV